jgi:hypothetical protein
MASRGPVHAASRPAGVVLISNASLVHGAQKKAEVIDLLFAQSFSLDRLLLLAYSSS